MFFPLAYILMVILLNLKLILKGFVVGVGKIIPGVSGSMLAITLGIYDKLLEAVTNFFGDAKNNFKFLLNFGIGAFLAIILFSKFILFLLNTYYNETMYLFLGLIIGTVIPFIKELDFRRKNKFIFISVLLLMFLIPSGKGTSIFIFKGTFVDFLYVVFLGMIDAFSSIVPGISGTAIFMMLGAYEFVLSVLGNPFSLVFIIYALGLVLGIILICYLMYFLLKRFKLEVYSVIFALMVSSIMLLFRGLIASFSFSLLFMLGLGIIIGYLFDK